MSNVYSVSTANALKESGAVPEKSENAKIPAVTADTIFSFIFTKIFLSIKVIYVYSTTFSVILQGEFALILPVCFSEAIFGRRYSVFERKIVQFLCKPRFLPRFFKYYAEFLQVLEKSLAKTSFR